MSVLPKEIVCQLYSDWCFQSYLRYELLYVATNPPLSQMFFLWVCLCMSSIFRKSQIMILVIFCICVRLRRKYGAPISRKRLFLLMIQKDVLRDDVSPQDLPSYVQKKLDDMKVSTTVGWFLVSNSWTKICTWILLSQSVVSLVPLIPTSTPAVQTLRTDLMLPADHPAVQRDTSRRRRARIANAAKWLGLVCFFLVSWSDLFPGEYAGMGFQNYKIWGLCQRSLNG